MTKNRRMTVATRRNYDSLTKTMCELIEKKPYEEITVKEICALSGVPRATFYNYFKEKHELLQFCFEQIMEYFDQKGKRYDLRSKEYIEYMTRMAIAFVKSNKAIVNVMLSPVDNSGVTFVQKILAERIQATFPDGIVAKIPIGLLAEYVSSSIVYTVKWYLEEGDNYTEDEIVDYAFVLVNAERLFVE